MNLSKFLKTTEGKLVALALVALAIYLLWREEIESVLRDRGLIEPKAVNPTPQAGPSPAPGEQVTNEIVKRDVSPKLIRDAKGDFVKDAQRALVAMNYKVPVDGLWGPKDESALMQFAGRRSMTYAEFNALYQSWRKKNAGIRIASPDVAGRGTIGPNVRQVAPAGSTVRYQTGGVGSSRFLNDSQVRANGSRRVLGVAGNPVMY